MRQDVTSEKDVILALALASGDTTSGAAAKAGVCRATVSRRLGDPEFRRLVSEFRNEVVAESLGKMAANMTRAADTLAALLAVDDDKVRLRTARAVISLGMRLRDSVDLNDRIRELENELARKQGATP